ncbi:MAG TPA: serine/threonine-protein kinase [Myxococcales bacterium]|nr:serine/threonine-protein kinase [Myxococcales bacterium]
MEATTAEPLGTVDRYRLLEQVGSGGMSQVYRAWDTSLDREVAVKLLHPHLASKEESRRRFSREARAVAKLRHPNILEIFDFSGDLAPKAFIVTEFIRGQTLKGFADQVGFGSPSLAALAAHSLAVALEHAHGLGIVHRDIKPENVMVRDDGVLKLMDFGIARVLDQGERMTMTGTLVGSPAHMAPEIIEGKEADERADIFSLGTLLYWLCTGALPFAASNTTAVLKRILDGDYEDPRVACPEVSDSLCGVLRDAMARDPDERIPSAQALRVRLEETLREDGLERPAEELRKFFEDPAGYREHFRAQLSLRLVGQARDALKAGQRAKALSLVNRILAIEPRSEEGQRILTEIRGGERRRRMALAAGAIVGAVALGYGGWVAWTNRPPERPTAMATSTPTPTSTSTSTATATATATPTPTARPTPTVTPTPTLAPSREHPTLAARLLGVRHPRVESPPPAPRPRPPALPGQLQIRVAPFATAFVDGQRQGPTDVPAFDLSLPQGPHDIRLVNAACEPWEQRVDVGGADSPPLRVRLRWKPASLTVDATPADADVMVDGFSRGTASQSRATPIPVPMENDARRKVSIRVFKKGYRDYLTDQELQAATPLSLHVKLVAE